MRRYAPWMAVTALLVTLSACHDKESAPAEASASSPPAAAAAPAPEAAPAPAPAPAATEAGVEPLAAHGSAMGAPAEAPAATTPAAAPAASQAAAPAAAGPTIAFDLPKGWQSVAPQSSMRMAQATIPGSGGPGELGVFFFGPGQGGSAEANLQRWSGQFEGGAAPQRGSFTAHGFKVTWIDVAGTMEPVTMGMGPRSAQSGYRLLGGVVEGTGGPWFFKATGPDATLGPQREAFLAMLRSVRPK
jgi:hypothetical protein